MLSLQCTSLSTTVSLIQQYKYLIRDLIIYLQNLFVILTSLILHELQINIHETANTVKSNNRIQINFGKRVFCLAICEETIFIKMSKIPLLSLIQNAKHLFGMK